MTITTLYYNDDDHFNLHWGGGTGLSSSNKRKQRNFVCDVLQCSTVVWRCICRDTCFHFCLLPVKGQWSHWLLGGHWNDPIGVSSRSLRASTSCQYVFILSHWWFLSQSYKHCAMCTLCALWRVDNLPCYMVGMLSSTGDARGEQKDHGSIEQPHPQFIVDINPLTRQDVPNRFTYLPHTW